MLKFPSPLYAVADDTASEQPLAVQVEWLLEAGVRLIQLRCKRLGDDALRPLARAAVAQCRARGAWLIVNDRVEIARDAGAHGVHLGQGDRTPAQARAVLGEDFLIGYSTHDEVEFARGLAGPADYLALGPVFATHTKEVPYADLGVEGVRRFAARKDRPLVAIGGISAGDAAELLAAGADAVAVIGALWRAPDPRAAAAALLRAVGGPTAAARDL